MSTIEICVIIITVVVVFERVSVGLAAWTQIRGINWLKDQIRELRAEIGLGATIGGAVGAAGAALMGKKRRQAPPMARPKVRCATCGGTDFEGNQGAAHCTGCGALSPSNG